MITSTPQLDRIDLSTNSRNVLAALVKLLTPHIPYSIHILGAILNSGPRASTLQDVDPSKIALWSTIPLDHDVVPTTDRAEPFSIIAFSHLNCQFSIFCSSDSSASSDPPTETEKAHIKYVFEYTRDMARAARPTHDGVLTPRGSAPGMHPPMIVVGAVHPKWAEVLAPMSMCQSPNVRYAFPREVFARDDAMAESGKGVKFGEDEVEVCEIRTSDLPFVHGASTILRSDAYLLSRAPYSACLWLREDNMAIGKDGGRGRLVACVLMHTDGSVGALRVHAEHQRRGLGRMVLRALVEKLDFSQSGGKPGISDDHQDLGGGALGWFWTDTGVQNEAGNRFLTSVVGEAGSWLCHWTYIHID